MLLRTPRVTDVSQHAQLDVLIVDDQPSVREGLVLLLGSEGSRWGTIRCAATLAEARQCIHSLVPDIVLLDVDLAGDDGLSLLPDLVPGARVLVLTTQADPDTRDRAARMGAAGLMLKSAPAEDLLAGVQALAAPHLRGDETPMQVGTGL